MKSTSLLPHVSKPGRYLGKEFNSIQKDWQSVNSRFALVFPDLYEIGMSHLGLQILYHILNQQDSILAERCFCPDVDAEKVMKEKSIRLTSLESARPLVDFDVIGITLPYELCYTNILTILSLAGIPFHSRDRNESHPLLLGGGSCSLNPEPVADFFDAVLLGDGEEGIVDIADTVAEAKAQKWDRQHLFEKLARIKGVYIPSLYAVEYHKDGTINRISHAERAPEKVERRILQNLDNTTHLHSPIVPNAKIIHDRLGVEIARGCTRGCRFCQAGMIYRPVRERSVEQILELADRGITTSGFEELALLSLSTGDYSCIDRLLPRLMDTYAQEYVSVSMPSMRVGTLSPELMEQIKRVRKTGFTIAPEAGSERLRKVINKGITEEDMVTTCRDAFAHGWNGIKLYFMIGLPTESEEDVAAIGGLSQKIVDTAKEAAGRRKQVTASIGTFVPKPHTPFQWERQLTLDESRERIHYIRRCMPRKGCKLKYHDPEMSFLEGVLSRGDRRLSPLIEMAWHDGARLDSWSDYFSLELWNTAASACGLDLDFYLRARDHGEILPWHHLSSGVSDEFLQRERANSLEGVYTPDCRYHGCQQCGLCDFTTILPIVRRDSGEAEPSTAVKATDTRRRNNGTEKHFRYMVSYSRKGRISYLGHLEILQMFFRAIRRANIRTHFSQGFNPSPKISFGGALPVGMESDSEYFIMDLPEIIDDIGEVMKTLNDSLPDGIEISDIRLHSGRIPQRVLNCYTVDLPRDLTEHESEAIDEYLATDFYFVDRKRKGKSKELDIRPLIPQLRQVNGRTLTLQVDSRAGEPGIKVQEALAQICAFSEEDILESRIRKTSWHHLSEKDG